MKEVLNRIRNPVPVSLNKKTLYSGLVFTAGIALGLISKVLDETASNLLPYFLESLDLRNFFSRMGVWLFIGVCISVYSKTPLRAGCNVFSFFVGMVGSYYFYTVFVAGFFPQSYMMIWVAMTAFSPFMGVVCWYAKGTHIASMTISVLIFTIMARQSFSFGFWYFDISYGLELLLLIATTAVLYETPKQILTVLGVGMILFFILSPMNLFWGML